LGSSVPGILHRPARAATADRGDGTPVLVVIQLAGGNDGLNTVVPFTHDEYAKHRPTLRLAAKDVHKIDSELGFHPRMQGFAKLLDRGLLSVVQGVGYPNPNGDHGAAMRDWQTAMPHQPTCQTGWLGRAADSMCRPGEAVVPAVFVGSIARPFVLNSERAIVPAVRSLQQGTVEVLPPKADTSAASAYRRSLMEAAEVPRPVDGNPLPALLRRSTLDAHAASRQIEQAATTGSSAARGYPPFELAAMLKTIGQLIRADLGIRVFCTELGGGAPGGFDNHANQLGNHCALLEQLSASVTAFVNDLQRDKLLDRVVLMTYSEFGRTVAENGRRGTGHSSAAPVFLAGGRLREGLIGAHPSLTTLENGGPAFHTDFRRVYATMLGRWLGLDAQSILGGSFEPLDLLKA